MQSFEGAVLFVDILGVSALTTSSLPLVALADFEALGRNGKGNTSNQVFCANLLSIFRSNLLSCKAKNLKIAQLSDCAFLWSSDIDCVVTTSKKLFTANSKSGILARGGMAYGQIVEPSKTNSSIGLFVCGEAATRAAQLEGSGKDARIFVDQDLPGQRFQSVRSDAFRGLTNISNFQILDEFLWFTTLPHYSTEKDQRSAALELAELVGIYRYSPKFRWNEASSEGKVHLGATIERLSMELRSLCEGLRIAPPEFLITTSELYLASHDPLLRSEARLSKFYAHFDRWKSVADVQ